MNTKLRLALAALCASGAVLACLAYADAARAQVIRERDAALARYGGELVTLVVSSTALETGDIVSRNNVSEREWISDLAPEGAVTNIDDVLGKSVSVPLAQGAPITELTFRDDSHAFDVPSGHVALVVPLTDKLGVSQTMAVGSRVLAYSTTHERAVALASDVTILELTAQQGSFSQSESITLSVLPQDVQALLLAASNDSLRLIMPAEDVESILDTPSSGDTAAEMRSTDEAVEDVMPKTAQSADASTGAASVDAETVGPAAVDATSKNAEAALIQAEEVPKGAPTNGSDDEKGQAE